MHKNKQAVTYFIADLHLSESRPDISACFFAFLKNDAIKAHTLYILGDLFEYWIGDDDNSAFCQSVAQALKALADTGTTIYFIHGNRDFLLGNKYAERCGMILLPEIQLIDLYGQAALIMHGDTLCTLDIDYQKFRKKSRTWWWQTLIKNLPLAMRRKIAQKYRAQSALSQQSKAQDIMDVTPNEVIKVLNKYQCLLLIHGHTHRPAVHQLTINNSPAQRIVLGDWYEQGSWLKVSKNECQLMSQKF